MISPTRGTLEILLFVCTVSTTQEKKYEIVAAGLSVYGLTQAPRSHFSLRVVSIRNFSFDIRVKV